MLSSDCHSTTSIGDLRYARQDVGDAGTLNASKDQIPYFDAIAQSESDEFWYFCVPNDQTLILRVAAILRFARPRWPQPQISTGSITVDSNRNFIINDNVNTLEGRVETTVR
jgi:hypothetical protein